MDSKKSPNLAKKICCIFCDYSTSKHNDYSKHLLTAKHKKNENDSKMIVNHGVNSQKVAKAFKCECGNEYKYDSGYYRHKKKCNNNISQNISKEDEKNNEITDINDKNLMLTLIHQNNELQKQMLEVIKNGTNNTTISNSHNKTFNLQVFLNETCKDAMNIMDFVDSIKIQLCDI